MTNNITRAEYVADRKTAFAATAKACRYAAVMDWAPTNTGALIIGALEGDEWECCALGALALQHKLERHVVWVGQERTMPDLLDEVADMSLTETLRPVFGIKDRSVASAVVASVFDRMAEAYHRARFGYAMGSMDRRVLEQNGLDAEALANLSRREFWLLVAKRFEGLSR